MTYHPAIWDAILDDKYDCSVKRTGPYTGLLLVKEGDKILFSQEVGLMYGAAFGPDVEDVNSWINLIETKFPKI